MLKAHAEAILPFYWLFDKPMPLNKTSGEKTQFCMS